MVSVFLLVFLFLLIAIEITIKAIDNITYQLLTEEQKAEMAEVSTQVFKIANGIKN
jgi:cytochrome c oxidase cbb3-type subunit 3